MAVRGETITFEDIKAALGSIPRKDLVETDKFIHGDHWQDTAGWTGWRPESNSLEAQAQWQLVERLFNSKNVCGGMVKRVRGATLGREPDWEIIEKKDPKSSTNGNGQPVANKFKEDDDILTRWWEEKEIHSKLKQFITNRTSYGKAGLRIFIPSGFVKSISADGVAQIGASDLASALEKIVVEVPNYLSVIDVEDVEFGQWFPIVHLKKKNETDDDKYEICAIDEDGKTILRQVSETTQNNSRMIKIDLGGNLLTMVDGEYTSAMISPTVKLQQKAVNHAKTGENFALANINFPETTFINASLATETTKDSSGKDITTVKPMRQGAGIWRNLKGIWMETAEGAQTITTPQVVYRDGADPKKFAEVADNNTRDMHQEAGMLYIYLADSEYASGDARIEAMTDYLILLVDAKTMMDNIGVWLLTTVLRLAYTLCGQTEKADKFTVLFDTKLTIGRLSTDDKRLMIEEVNAGLRSKRGYLITAEVSDDPDGELQAVKSDPPQPMLIGSPNGNGNPQPAPAPTQR